MSRHTCHIKVLATRITLPDPDGEGEITCFFGETRLVRRSDAEAILEKEADLTNKSLRILTDEESSALDASA